MEKPFYISQLPEKTQAWIKEKTKENFLKDGMSEEEAEQKATDFLDEKVNVAEDFFGKDFYKSLDPAEDKLDHEVVNDFAIDAIKDNFTPPGAKGEKKRMIRSKDKPEDVWDNEDVFKRFAITPYIKQQDDKDREQFWKEEKARSIDDLMNDKDYKDWYEFVGDEEDVTPNNASWKSEYGEGEGNPYADIDELIDKWDTNDNGKIEVDEMEDFQKSLDDYAAKNKKGRDDIPVTTRR